MGIGQASTCGLTAADSKLTFCLSPTAGGRASKASQLSVGDNKQPTGLFFICGRAHCPPTVADLRRSR